MEYLRRVRAVLAILALSALAFAGCDIRVEGNGFSIGPLSGRATDEWQRTYTVPPGGSVEIVNVNGRIRVMRGTGSDVVVRAERVARASTDESARELLDQVRLEESSGDGGVKIETRVPRVRGRGGVEVHYDVAVPDGLSVTVRTTNGGIALDRVDGRVIAATVNGGIDGTGLAGHIDASTTNGAIDLEVADVRDGVRAKTVNGGVSVLIPKSTRADLVASVVNGGISVDSVALDEAVRNRRRLEGRLNGGGPSIELGTVNGGIRLAGQ